MTRILAVEEWFENWTAPERIEVIPTPTNDSADVDQLCDSIVRTLKDKKAQNACILVLCTDWKPFAHARRYDQHGVTLLKHLRLTPNIGDAARMPVVMFSFEPLEELIRKKPGNLMLLSRGVTFLRLPEGLDKLRDVNFLADRSAILADTQEMDFKASVRADYRENPLDPHSFRNRYGALKLCTEFAGDILGANNDYILELSRKAWADLDMKRHQVITGTPFISPQPTGGEWQDFRESNKRCKVLLIDDEHNKGWSLALLAGLGGEQVTAEDYQRFLATQPDSSLRNLRAISDHHKAKQFLDKCRSDFMKALEMWNKAADAADMVDLEVSEAANKVINANSAQQQSKKAADEARASLLQAESSLSNAKIAAQQLLKPFLDVAEECITAPETETGPVIETLERSRRTLVEIGHALEVLADASARLRNAQRKFDEAAKKAEMATTALAEAERLLSDSKRNQQEAKRLLNDALGNLGKHIPFDAVLLDLRLDPIDDGSRSISDVSGIRLLRYIRETIPPIPVLMLTASEKAVSYAECMAAGASGYWIKGVSTGEEMRNLLFKILAQRDLLPIWQKMEQVKAKTTVAAKTWGGTGFVPRTIPASAPKRRAINALLEDSYRRLWEASDSNGVAHKPVIINLGGIQEIRLGINPKDLDNARLWSSTPKEDQELHGLRNEVAHATATPVISRAGALKFLSYTLDQLLA